MNNYMNSQNAAFSFASTVAMPRRHTINRALPEPQDICCDDAQPEVKKARAPMWQRALLGLLELPLSVLTSLAQGAKMPRY